jgi:hypothetical protein
MLYRRASEVDDLLYCNRGNSFRVAKYSQILHNARLSSDTPLMSTLTTYVIYFPYKHLHHLPNVERSHMRKLLAIFLTLASFTDKRLRMAQLLRTSSVALSRHIEIASADTVGSSTTI